MHSEISRPLLLSNYKNIFGTERQLCFKIDKLNYACMRIACLLQPTRDTPALHSPGAPHDPCNFSSEHSLSLSQCRTVVPHCCKGDAASQWEMAILGVSTEKNTQQFQALNGLKCSTVGNLGS